MMINYNTKIISCLFIIILLLSFSFNGCIKINKDISNQIIKDENKTDIIDLGKIFSKGYISPYDDEEKGYLITQGVVLENDIMYISGKSDRVKVDFEGVLALNLKENKILWKTIIQDGALYGSIIKYDNYLYVTSDKYLTCLDKNTGKLIFKKEFECLPYLIPVIHNNILYVGGRIPPKFYSLYALNTDTGEEIFSIVTGEHFNYEPTFYNNMAFYNTTTGSIFAIRYNKDSSSKYQILWKRLGQNYQDPLVGSPVYWNGNVYSQYHPGAYWNVSDRYLICYDALTGKEKWKLLLAHWSDIPLNDTTPYEYLVKFRFRETEYDVYYQQPFLYRDRLYLVTDKGFLVIDPLKETIKKAIHIENFANHSDFVNIKDDYAYWWNSTAEDYNMIYLYDLDKEMLDMVIKTPVDNKLWVSSILIKNNIYIVSDCGIIFTVDKESKKSIGAFKIYGNLTIDIINGV